MTVKYLTALSCFNSNLLKVGVNVIEKNTKSYLGLREVLGIRENQACLVIQTIQYLQ